MKRNLFRRALACLCLCAVLSGRLCVPARAAGFRGCSRRSLAADAISQCVTQGWFRQERRYLRCGPTHDPERLRRGAEPVFRLAEQRRLLSDFFRCAPRGMVRAALRACYEHGAVTRQTGTYRPGDAVTREELAVTLIRALGYGPIGRTCR